jgi:acyl-CoA synthetase (AMP-forming)/AMP-acid ligase II
LIEHVRDPLAERLIGPGKPYEIEAVEVFGRTQQVFKGRPRTLAEIYRRAMGFGSRPMVVQDQLVLSYDEVFAQASALARSLRDDYGVKRGTMVAMFMANRVEWLPSLIAITALGAVAVLVNSRGAAEEIARAVEATDCQLIIADTDRAALLDASEQKLALPRIVIGAHFARLSQPLPGQTLEPVEMRPDEGAIVLFTSGTTGFPKGALLSHGAVSHAAMLSGFMGALQDLRYTEETGRPILPHRRSMSSPAVILGPLFHLGGLNPVIRAMTFGATVFIMGKWNADVALDMIEQHGVSRLAFVPAMLGDILRSPRRGPANIGSLHFLVNSAAALNPAVVAEARAQLPDSLFVNTYGQTENTGWVTQISGRAYIENPAACGWTIPTVSVRVRRDDGSEAAPGEPGELWVRSACVMTGYYGDAHANAAALEDGWQATGDIGAFDEKGLLSILDRKTNMVISGGENIYCAEVERVLAEYKGVREVIAYGEPDERLGERLAVTVVTDAGATFGEEDLKAYCKSRLAIYKTPRVVRLTQELLPRNATGKFDKRKVVEKYRATR